MCDTRSDSPNKFLHNLVNSVIPSLDRAVQSVGVRIGLVLPF